MVEGTREVNIVSTANKATQQGIEVVKSLYVSVSYDINGSNPSDRSFTCTQFAESPLGRVSLVIVIGI